jgi:protein gp37
VSAKTIVAWTDSTFSIAWGCQKISQGCEKCYAETLSTRFGNDVWGPGKDRRTFGPTHWAEPEKWNRKAEREGRRHRVFSSSMCDIFEDHPTITREREKLWALIERTPWLDWQLLTKRADRIAANLPANWDAIRWHVWMGVSIENNDYVGRADHLRSLTPPAAVNFVSYEPALGPLDALDLTGISWVICGGESGVGFRPMDLDWARQMRDRCHAANVAWFFKQNSHRFTERGVELDGRVMRGYPTPRVITLTPR